MPIMSKDIGITARALFDIVQQPNGREVYETLLEKLQVPHLTCYWHELEKLCANVSLINSHAGKNLQELFETDKVLLIKQSYDREEITVLRTILDTRAPDNCGIVVYSIKEYIDSRVWLGTEDIYDAGGNRYNGG